MLKSLLACEITNMKRVSIITPFYRGKNYLLGLTENISKCSKYTDDSVYIEWVISNDDPDNPLYFVPQVEADEIKILNTKVNRGIQGARVEGLKKASGDYILFLDQDDCIAENWISSQLEEIKEADAVVSDWIEDGKSVYNTRIRPSLEDSIKKEYNINYRCGFIPGQVLIKKDSIPLIWQNRILSTSYCDDYYLWVSMFSSGCVFRSNPNTTYEHVINGYNQSMKRDLWVKSLHELLHIINEEKLLSEAERMDFFASKEKEIEALVESMSWDKLRMEIVKRLCKLSHLSTHSPLVNDRILGRHVAVYGVDMGECVASILSSMGISVDCFIDRDAGQLKSFVPIYTCERIPASIDIIINTLLRDDNKKEVTGYINTNRPDIDVIDIMDIAFDGKYH